MRGGNANRVSILNRRTVAACVLPAVAALALSACGSSSSDDSAGSSSSPAVTSEAASVESNPAATDPTDAGASTDTDASAGAAAGTGAGAGAGSTTAININKTVTDPVMGEKFTVMKVIPSYPVTTAEKAKYSALEDEKVVLVQLKVTASSKYYDSFGADSFYLVGDPGQGFDDASTTILDDDIKAAGYAPLPDAETGKTTTGWVVFTPKQDKAHLTLRYKRLAAGTSNGKTISAKNFDVPLD